MLKKNYHMLKKNALLKNLRRRVYETQTVIETK